MKWYEARVDAHREPEAQRLLDETDGLLCYGVKTILYEMVSDSMNAENNFTPTVKYSLRTLSRLLNLSAAKLRKILVKLNDFSQLDANLTQDSCEITIHKLLELKDRYAKICAHTAQNVLPTIQPHHKTNTKQEITQPPPPQNETEPQEDGGGGGESFCVCGDGEESQDADDVQVIPSDAESQHSPDSPAGGFIRKWRQVNAESKEAFNSGTLSRADYSRRLARIAASALGQEDERGINRVLTVMEHTSGDKVRWAVIDLLTDPTADGKRFAYLEYRAKHPQDKRKHKTENDYDIPF